MYSVSKTFSFCYGHRLLGDKGKCRHLHGHTGKATFTLEAEDLDKLSMVIHFDRLKETMGRWISENLDHTLLLHRNDPMADVLRKTGERFRELNTNPTAEGIASMLFDVAFDCGLPIAKVDVWESETSKATYVKP